MPTVKQIKAELDQLGISYPSKARKAELEKLLAKSRKESLNGAQNLLEDLTNRNSTKQEIKAEGKKFVAAAKPTLKLLAKIKKTEEKAEQKIEKDLKEQKEETDVVVERIKRFQKKHGDSLLEASGGQEGAIKQQLARIFKGTRFQRTECKWRGDVSDKPVYLSLCHPLEKDKGKGRCDYRVCFDAREMLKKRKKGSSANPLLVDGDDAKRMSPKVDDSFWDLLEIAVEIGDLGLENGILQSRDAVDHMIVMSGVTRGIKRHIKQTKGFFAQYGQIWKGVKQNTLLKHIYGGKDTDEGMLTKILRVPFYAFVLPLVSDIVKVIVCFMAQGESPIEVLEIIARTVKEAFPNSGIGKIMQGIYRSFGDCLKSGSTITAFYNCFLKPAPGLVTGYLGGLYAGTASLIAEIIKDYIPFVGQYTTLVKTLEKKESWLEWLRFDEESRVYKNKTNLVIGAMPESLQSVINTTEILSVVIISSIPVSISLFIVKGFLQIARKILRFNLAQLFDNDEHQSKKVLVYVDDLYNLLSGPEAEELFKESIDLLNTVSLAFLELGTQVKPIMNVLWVTYDWISMFVCIFKKSLGLQLTLKQKEKGCCLGALIQGLKEIVPDQYARIKQAGVVVGGSLGAVGAAYGAAQAAATATGAKVLGALGTLGAGLAKDAVLSYGPEMLKLLSDDRLKDKITRVSKVGKHQIYLYRMKNNPQHVFYGISAQETKKILPQAVTVGKDGYLRIKLRKLPEALLKHLVQINSIDMKHARSKVVPKMKKAIASAQTK